MEKYFDVLKNVILFQHIQPGDLGKLLDCLNAREMSYGKNETILMAGDVVSAVGIMLTGRVQVIKEDIAGNRTIVTELEAGDLFAEAFSCAQTQLLPVSVISVTDSEVLLIDYRRIITTCSSACIFHAHLIENMLSILANKNILLNQKIEYLSKRTTREKLLAYLSDQAVKQKSNTFEIPFNRQALADYLCVDRSAMSNELSRLRDEGILNFNKNQFELTCQHEA